MSAVPVPVPATAIGGRLLLVGRPEVVGGGGPMRLESLVPTLQVASAEAAAQALAREPVAFVLSEVVLPGRNGLELCRLMRASHRLASIPALLVADGTTVDGRAAAMAAGASDYLVRPFGADTLRRAVALAWPAAASRLAPVAPASGSSEGLLAVARARLHDPGFGVSQWATCASLSERQLRRRILAATGLAPLAWLREQRLQGVRQLIDDGVCQGTHDAGRHVGMHNRNYLRRLYRARFADASEARSG